MGRIPTGLALLALLAVSGCQGLFARPRPVYGADILEEREVPDEPVVAALPAPPPAAPSLQLPPIEPIAPAQKPAVVEVAPEPAAKPAPVEEAPAVVEVAPEPEPVAEPRVHTVQKGETLQKISQIHYGTTRRWPAIFKHNEATMKSPDRLKVGMKLVLPD